MIRWQLVLAAAAAALLTACASGPQAPSMPGDFAADGRLSARGDVADRVINESANFRWRRTGERIDVELGSPLGDTQARLAVVAGQATLTLADGRSATAPDADALLTELTGLALPVSRLRWWLEGVPSPDTTVDELEADGASRRFTQDGWEVALFNAEPYPKRLTLKRDRFEVRIAVSSWQ
ncbi:lipoprotein insertase outer membrane protein LolB [Chitinolyticbacter albus]|uniref:lipoprotein insertase outer membrane protein LolB n=1 Tax=Chitinolyticbacter albus TaxID=2961951 RepID=UPI00210B8942|nr:lipoprotein insertase outer membrane protein LolB [Chitinolyticbacter albus]